MVNIRAEELVNGNPKLTLGLIWRIILHFQVNEIMNKDFLLIKMFSSLFVTLILKEQKKK